MPAAISVRAISKEYTLGSGAAHDTLRDRIAAAASGLLPRRAGTEAEREKRFHALREVSFELEEGQIMGIIGRNGAGKSTLLKILSQITEPTDGEILVHGKIASLLEVGTGFHAELTGRENIYLNGAILGMSRREIQAKFDEIVAFAEVSRFLDTPVKRYSSGMYVRLAFAVAAHLDPDILVIDEVLAVGDLAFQNRCLGKIRNVSRSGKTVLFVSHNLGMVSSLCTRGLILKEGRVEYDGDAEEAVKRYHHSVAAANAPHLSPHVLYENPAPGTEEFAIRRIEMREPGGAEKDLLGTWESVVLRIHYYCPRPVERGSVVCQIATNEGVRVMMLSTQPDGTLPMSLAAGEHRIELAFPQFPLAAGEYLMGAGLAVPCVEYLCWTADLCWLRVANRDVYGSKLAPEMPRSIVATPHTWREVD